MKRLLFLLAATALAATACASNAAPIVAPVGDPIAAPAKPARPARDEILETILASEKALLEEGDVDAHVAVWAPDAVIVRARGGTPGDLARALTRRPELTDKWLWDMFAISAEMMGEAEEAATAHARAAEMPSP